MDSIFRLDSKAAIVMNIDAVKLVPKLGALKEHHIRYLVLAYDSTNTIFKQQNYSTWKKLACEYVYGHSNIAKVEGSVEILSVLEIWQKLVYDEDRIQKAKLIERKRQLQDQLLTVEGSAKMKGIVESIGLIEKMITDLDSRISFADEEVILAAKNGKLSMIEKWQRKIKLMTQ